MIAFIANNLPSIIAGGIILIVLALVVVKMVRDKKKGKSSCACGCSGCPMENACHKR